MDLSHVHFRGSPTVRGHLAGRDPAAVAFRQPRPDQDEGATQGLPAFIIAACGLDPSAYRRVPLERRRAACLRALKADSEWSAREQIGRHPAQRARALSALLIGVSSFFRDAYVFDAVRRLVVPALQARAGRLRIWSVGCSTGAELYSVAMLLDEAGLLQRADLLGTDCRADAIADARGGLFPAASLADLDACARERWFEPAQGGWRVVPRLRAAARWAVSDATRETVNGPWDLVLCRNLVIYLRGDAADGLFGRLAGALAPGGFLVVGKAERPPASLGLTAAARCIYRSHGVR